jgi:hypothetical protein
LAVFGKANSLLVVVEEHVNAVKKKDVYLPVIAFTLLKDG